jgi:multicomponent Na+:H+ antiporter subunit E
MSLVVLVSWLVIMWMALWGNLSWANLLGGVAAAVAVLLTWSTTSRRTPAYAFRPLAALRFLAYFCWKLLEANAILAWEVVTPRNRINEGIVAIPVQGFSDGLITLVANTITLTPGTVTLEVSRDPAVLYVHVLHLADIEAVRREVRHLEILAVRAFGSPEALAMLEHPAGDPTPDDHAPDDTDHDATEERP